METMVSAAAAVLTTVAFVPQAIHIIRFKETRAISLQMYVVFASGVALWLVFGVMIWNWPIIAANAITLALALAIIRIVPELERSGDLADLSIEELANIAVPSVSKKPERLLDGPASVFVITADDIREGVVAVLSVFLRDPMFESQTKNRLTNPEIEGSVDNFVRPALEAWLNNNKTAADAIVSRIVIAARMREASRR